MKQSMFEESSPKKEPGTQSCLFCGRKEANMPVYSLGVGRLGICLDCANKAVEALNKASKKAATP